MNTGISKQENKEIRRLLVEAVKAIKVLSVVKSKRQIEKQKGASSEVINYANKGTKRIRNKVYYLQMQGFNVNKATAAGARKLTCFVWGMMTEHYA